MGTITVTSSGFGPLPVAAPAGWPSGVAWPGNGTIAPNGSRSTPNMTDAEMLQLFTWAAATWVAQGTPTAPTTPTVAQILSGWIVSTWQATKGGVQAYFTGSPSVPPQINLN